MRSFVTPFVFVIHLTPTYPTCSLTVCLKAPVPKASLSPGKSLCPSDPCQTKSGMGNVCSNPDGEVKLPDDGDDDDDAPETYDEESAERTNHLTRDSLPETQETSTAGSATEIAAPPTEVGNTPPVSNGHEPSLVVVLIDGDGLHVSEAAYGLQKPGS